MLPVLYGRNMVFRCLQQDYWSLSPGVALHENKQRKIEVGFSALRGIERISKQLPGCDALSPWSVDEQMFSWWICTVMLCLYKVRQENVEAFGFIQPIAFSANRTRVTCIFHTWC